MKIIYNRFIPFGRRFHAINLFGILFAKGPCDKVMMNHEKIHTSQIRELGYVAFYIIYFLEWLVKLFIYRNSFQAYSNLSFEREAYANETNLTYLSSRRHYSFLKYMKQR